MTNITETLERAVKLHQTGNLDQAEQLYRQILETRPQHIHALHLLGVALHQKGRNDLAVDYIGQSLRQQPEHADAHNNLGIALLELGKPKEAEACFHEALRRKPIYAEANNNLGNALRRQDQLAEAVACYRRALEQKPDYADAYNNLGDALRSQEKLDEARETLEQALRLNPNYPAAHNNLGTVLLAAGKIDDAMVHYREAVRLQPGFAHAHHNQAVALLQLGKAAEALPCAKEAVRLRPDYADAHLGMATCLLLQGNLEQGLPEYEWRFRCFPLPKYSQPRWDGTPLKGRSILLHAEQGLGDTLQFVRFAPLVRQLGGRVTVASQAILLPLLGSCPGIDRLVAEGTSAPAFDLQAPLLSIPGILGTTRATVPAQVPYLFAEADRVERWRRELGRFRGYKVGICWQGNPSHPADRQRSCPLKHFAPLAAIPGVELISLQKSPGLEQLEEVRDQFAVADLGPEVDKGAAFLDTAAIMRNLDLIVTVDTAVAHLAGALGVPVWVALSVSPDWRWMQHGEDSPWYPTMRLFRQPERGNWDGVFRQIADALRQRIAQAGTTTPTSIPIEIAPGELFDKISILQIKSERITDDAKLRHVRHELALLTAAQERCVPPSEELARLRAEIKAVNESLWQVEDDLRACERDADFGPRFVDLARSVYRTNDRRNALKRQLNELLGSPIMEVKEHPAYGR